MDGKKNIIGNRVIRMIKSTPFMLIRGGSSKGVYLRKCDLPENEQERNELILKIMEGSMIGDPRQIDGLGGAHSLTSKVAIVSLSDSVDCDIDYLFLQVEVGKGRISDSQTCGNILAGVLPFAIESRMIKPTSDITTARINLLNTNARCESTVHTPKGQVRYTGDTKIDGVVGTAAPIICNYMNTVGSTCGSLLPTGTPIDIIHGVKVTCIDNGMPVVVLRASDFGLNGNESKEELESDIDLKSKIEKIRLQAGLMMNLGDVLEKTIPKVCLISEAKNGGTISTRMFIPHVVHDAIGVLAAISVASVCLLPVSICHELFSEMKLDESKERLFSIEHPSGQIDVYLEYHRTINYIDISKSGIIRTARLITKGEVFTY